MSPSGVAGVLVPIFIVIAILGSALGYYMHRNRRLKRNFMAFASRYSPATGAAILNAVSNCTPPRTHFLSGLLTLEMTIFGLNMIMKSGLQFFILNEPL